MKKLFSILLAAVLAAGTMVLPASASFIQEEAYYDIAFSVNKAATAWAPDGTYTPGEYFDIAVDDTWRSSACADDANDQTAWGLDYKLALSWDDSYFYTYIQFVDPNGHDNTWGADPASMWYSGAIQINHADEDQMGESRLEYGVGLTSDSNELISNVWADYLGSGFAPKANEDYIVTVDGDTVTYEARTPFSAFTTLTPEIGAVVSACYVISWGNGQDYCHTQLAEGCTGNGKDAGAFAMITLADVGEVTASAAAPAASTAAGGDVVYLQTFDNVASYDDLGWEIVESLTTNTSTYTIENGALTVDNIGGNDSYTVVVPASVMDEVNKGDYTVGYDFTLLESGDTARYLAMLLNYDREVGNTYNSLHMRMKGYADWQNRFVGTWSTNMDLNGGYQGLPVFTSKDDGAISNRLFGLAYDDTKNVIAGQTIRYEMRVSNTNGYCEIYMNGVLISGTDEAGWDQFTWASEDYSEICLKSGGSILGTVDNIVVVKGLGIPEGTIPAVGAAAPAAEEAPAADAAPVEGAFDYAHFVASGNDPYVTYENVIDIDPEVVTWAQIKYRTITEKDSLDNTLTGQIYITPAAEPFIPVKWNHTGSWETIVVDLTSVSETTTLTSLWKDSLGLGFRFDIMESNRDAEANVADDPAVVLENSAIDVAYIAFFETEDAAKAFDGANGAAALLNAEDLCTLGTPARVTAELLTEVPVVEEPAAEEPAAEEVSTKVEENLFTGAAVTAVSGLETEGSNLGEAAIDGDLATRWSSNTDDAAYIIVDLGAVTPVDSLDIYWETACAADYTVEVSEDNENWTVVATVTDNANGASPAGEAVSHEWDAVAARYIKINCTRRNTEWGNSIWEMVAFESDAEVVKSLTVEVLEEEPAEETVEEPAAAIVVEEAPQTFDFGVIAAISALVSLAGFSLTRKR